MRVRFGVAGQSRQPAHLLLWRILDIAFIAKLCFELLLPCSLPAHSVLASACIQLLYETCEILPCQSHISHRPQLFLLHQASLNKHSALHRRFHDIFDDTLATL